MSMTYRPPYQSARKPVYSSLLRTKFVAPPGVANLLIKSGLYVYISGVNILLFFFSFFLKLFEFYYFVSLLIYIRLLLITIFF